MLIKQHLTCWKQEKCENRRVVLKNESRGNIASQWLKQVNKKLIFLSAHIKKYNGTRECKHKSLLSGCSFVVHFVDISSCWTGLIPNLKIQNHNSSISTSYRGQIQMGSQINQGVSIPATKVNPRRIDLSDLRRRIAHVFYRV